MAFFIGFIYNILRTMKDTLLITAEGSGAEVIPFIKVWGILPGAFFITFIYSRLNNKLSRNSVFYAMVALFLSFFALFTFFIYPLRDYLHPYQLADAAQSHLPLGFKGLITMFRYWTFSSFYIMSELWSTAILSMLFWGFANDITPLNEAKRFYALIAIGLNLAAIFSGQISAFFSSRYSRSLFAFSDNAWQQTMVLLTCTVLISGLIIIGLYWYLTEGVKPTKERKKEKGPKIKMSMRESFRYLCRSKYLLNLAVIVLAYNIVINLIEVIWMDQVKQLYPDSNQFNSYMGHITTATGFLAMLASLFLSGQMIRKFGWTFTALFTPLIILATSIFFFICFFGRNSLNFLGFVTLLGTSPLTLIVFLGSLQNCLCRSSKFTLFDATKEMAFIPQSPEARLKGKAVIDGIGSRIGKSGGSLIHQILLILFSTISSSAPIVALILFAIIGVWLGSTVSLGKEFDELTQSQTASAEEKKEEKELASVK